MQVFKSLEARRGELLKLPPTISEKVQIEASLEDSRNNPIKTEKTALREIYRFLCNRDSELYKNFNGFDHLTSQLLNVKIAELRNFPEYWFLLRRSVYALLTTQCYTGKTLHQNPRKTIAEYAEDFKTLFNFIPDRVYLGLNLHNPYAVDKHFEKYFDVVTVSDLGYKDLYSQELLANYALTLNTNIHFRATIKSLQSHKYVVRKNILLNNFNWVFWENFDNTWESLKRTEVLKNLNKYYKKYNISYPQTKALYKRYFEEIIENITYSNEPENTKVFQNTMLDTLIKALGFTRVFDHLKFDYFFYKYLPRGKRPLLSANIHETINNLALVFNKAIEILPVKIKYPHIKLQSYNDGVVDNPDSYIDFLNNELLIVLNFKKSVISNIYYVNRDIPLDLTYNISILDRLPNLTDITSGYMHPHAREGAGRYGIISLKTTKRLYDIGGPNSIATKYSYIPSIQTLTEFNIQHGFVEYRDKYPIFCDISKNYFGDIAKNSIQNAYITKNPYEKFPNLCLGDSWIQDYLRYYKPKHEVSSVFDSDFLLHFLILLEDFLTQSSESTTPYWSVFKTVGYIDGAYNATDNSNNHLVKKAFEQGVLIEKLGEIEELKIANFRKYINGTLKKSQFNYSSYFDVSKQHIYINTRENETRKFILNLTSQLVSNFIRNLDLFQEELKYIDGAIVFSKKGIEILINLILKHLQIIGVDEYFKGINYVKQFVSYMFVVTSKDAPDSYFSLYPGEQKEYKIYPENPIEFITALQIILNNRELLNSLNLIEESNSSLRTENFKKLYFKFLKQSYDDFIKHMLDLENAIQSNYLAYKDYQGALPLLPLNGPISNRYRHIIAIQSSNVINSQINKILEEYENLFSKYPYPKFKSYVKTNLKNIKDLVVRIDTKIKNSTITINPDYLQFFSKTLKSVLKYEQD